MASADFFDVEITGRGGHGALSAPVDRSRHRRRQHPARHAEPRSRARSRRRRRPSSPWGRSWPGPSTTSSRRPRSCAARCAPSARPCAIRSRSGWARSRRDIARAYRAEATLGFMGEGCPTVVNHERESAPRARVRGGRAGRRRRDGRSLVMASDDMSLFLQARPGCYFQVGHRAGDWTDAPASRAGIRDERGRAAGRPAPRHARHARGSARVRGGHRAHRPGPSRECVIR